MKSFYTAACMLLFFYTHAQTIQDGLMMPKGDLCTGFLFTHDRWTNYWEGTLKRENGNIGTITTNSLTWLGNYGITDKINFIAMLPYVSTRASQGVLSGMQGLQDLTLAGKYNALEKSLGRGTFRGFVVGSYATPVSDYSFDFLPLSIGLGTQRVSGRVTLNYSWPNGWYVNGTTAYTWRSNVTLDRPSYYSDGQNFLTNEVWMPNVMDFSFMAGRIKNGLELILAYHQQNTLGGGDIRRQDMPFVSNRMNFSRVEATGMYYLPMIKNLAVRAQTGYTLAGRNVGQSFYVTAGVLYTFHFSKKL
ncbi:MAG: transporter [Cyclobacteriaceae bacterium]